MVPTARTCGVSLRTSAPSRKPDPIDADQTHEQTKPTHCGGKGECGLALGISMTRNAGRLSLQAFFMARAMVNADGNASRLSRCNPDLQEGSCDET
jgi:hypothetical protein